MSSPARKQLPIVGQRASDDLGDAFREATTHDLVFAVVGHAGSGPSRIGYALLEGLKSSGYDASLIKISKLIGETSREADPAKWKELESKNWLTKIQALQDAGNALRRDHSPSFTAALAIRDMHDMRRKRGEGGKPLAFVLDSLKNPDEVDALRRVYGRSFYLVSVVCSPGVRRKRLQTKFKDASAKDIDALMDRDEAEDAKTGQQVRKTIHVADFFVSNEAERPPSGPDPVDEALSRFLQIVSASEIVRPTQDERGMHAAWSAALRSSCLSRQVGAAVLDDHGELIASGTNEVPRAGGGVYEDGDAPDHRCFAYADDGESAGYCRNDKAKRTLLEVITEKLRSAGLLAEGVDPKTVGDVLMQTPIADLIEFSRAVHAEMEAIVALARNGVRGARGGTLYCTTLPCHACARHIVAAGFSEVVYYEPYVKSRAFSLHGDSIIAGPPAGILATKAASSSAESQPVEFRLFTGVAPRRFSPLFEKRRELKLDGKLRAAESDGIHTDPIFTKSHLEFEELIANKVKEATSGVKSARGLGA